MRRAQVFCAKTLNKLQQNYTQTHKNVGGGVVAVMRRGNDDDDKYFAE